MTQQILCVLSDDSVQSAISDALDHSVPISYLDSAEGIDLKCQELNPDLVLIDSSAEHFDALSVCKSMRAQSQARPISILYLAKHGGIEDRWLANDAGADDFLIFPFTREELQFRLHGLAKQRADKQAFIEREQSARNVAVQSMKEAHQYGLILQFIRNTNHCRAHEELAQIAFETINQLGLTSAIQIRQDDELISLRSSGEWCSPLEMQLFKQLRGQGRIFEYENRCVFNDRHISLLIKNMRHDDEHRGRLRDILAYVVEGIEATYVQIKQRNALLGLLSDCRNTVGLIEDSFSNHARQTVDIMDSTMLDMQDALHYLSLTEEQESYFIDLVNRNMTKLLSVHNDSQMIDSAFSEIITKLEGALKS